MARPAQTVDSAAHGETGSLFKGIHFFVLARVPQRNLYVEQIKANGGVVVILDKHADIKIDDHLRKSPAPDCFSYTWIEQCIRESRLVDKEPHRASKTQPRARPVGASVPGRGTRVPYTEADDVFLQRWVHDKLRQGLSFKGNEMYKDLEKANNRHPWQSWRDRYVKYLSANPSPPSVFNNYPTAQPVVTTDQAASVNQSPRHLQATPAQRRPPAQPATVDTRPSQLEEPEQGSSPLPERIASEETLRQPPHPPSSTSNGTQTSSENPHGTMSNSNDVQRGQGTRKLPDGGHVIRAGGEEAVFTVDQIGWLSVEASALLQVLASTPDGSGKEQIWDTLARAWKIGFEQPDAPSGRLWEGLFQERVQPSVDTSRRLSEAAIALPDDALGEATPQQVRELRLYSDRSSQRWSSPRSGSALANGASSSRKRDSRVLDDARSVSTGSPSAKKRARFDLAALEAQKSSKEGKRFTIRRTLRRKDEEPEDVDRSDGEAVELVHGDTAADGALAEEQSFDIWQGDEFIQEEQENAPGSPERQARRDQGPEQRVAVFTGESDVRFLLEPTTEGEPQEGSGQATGQSDLERELQDLSDSGNAPAQRDEYQSNEGAQVSSSPPILEIPTTASMGLGGQQTKLDSATSQPSPTSDTMPSGQEVHFHDAPEHQDAGSHSPSVASYMDDLVNGLEVDDDMISMIRPDDAIGLPELGPELERQIEAEAETQALLDRETQQADLEMLLPSSPPDAQPLLLSSSRNEERLAASQRLQLSKPPEDVRTISSPPKPSASAAPPRPTDEEVEAFIAELVGRGRREEDVLRVLDCTMLNLATARKSLSLMPDDGVIPDNVRGCWTPDDDRKLLRGNVAAQHELEAYHGVASYRERAEWLDSEDSQ